jgi:hypothetical protein
MEAPQKEFTCGQKLWPKDTAMSEIHCRGIETSDSAIVADIVFTDNWTHRESRMFLVA